MNWLKQHKLWYDVIFHKEKLYNPNKLIFGIRHKDYLNAKIEWQLSADRNYYRIVRSRSLVKKVYAVNIHHFTESVNTE